LGNSAIKWCVASNPADFQTAYLPEHASLGFLSSIWSGLEPTKEIWLSAVGPSVWQQLICNYAKAQDVLLHQVHSVKSYGLMRNAYQTPESLGVDRWLAAIAAWYSTRQAVIVIDAGTAVTVDAVTRAGVFIGGVIMPGLLLGSQSLVRGTAALQVTTGDTGEFPKTTSAAIHRGVMLAVIGGIQAAATTAQSELGGVCRYVICGGDSELLQPYLSPEPERIPDLVLQGLLRVASL